MDIEPIGREALHRAINACTSLAEFSRQLGVSYQLVQGWLAPSRRFATPAEYCPAIERITSGAVRCEELRPDIEWSVLRKAARPKQVA